jgi:DNA-binding NtrC family response regulator
MIHVFQNGSGVSIRNKPCRSQTSRSPSVHAPLQVERGLPVEPSVKVLIIDDDNAMAQMCAKLIRRRGHMAVITGSGADALALIREAGDIDVVVSDVQMPQMTGVEVLAKIRAFDETLPVIIITGYANVLSPPEALELGASDYLMKPFEPETLISSIERAARSALK